MVITWTDFLSGGTQLAVLVAVTGLIYRVLRMFWPDVPEAVIQVIAAILSTVTSLTVLYTPGQPTHQWIMVGVASGILLSQNVVKSIDWISSAATKTGAPNLGIPEKPAQWYVDLHPELFPKPSAKRDAAEAVVGVDKHDGKPLTFVERRETAAEMQKPTPGPDIPVTPKRVEDPAAP